MPRLLISHAMHCGAIRPRRRLSRPGLWLAFCPSKPRFVGSRDPAEEAVLSMQEVDSGCCQPATSTHSLMETIADDDLHVPSLQHESRMLENSRLSVAHELCKMQVTDKSQSDLLSCV